MPLATWYFIVPQHVAEADQWLKKNGFSQGFSSVATKAWKSTKGAALAEPVLKRMMKDLPHVVIKLDQLPGACVAVAVEGVCTHVGEPVLVLSCGCGGAHGPRGPAGRHTPLRAGCD